MPNVYDIGDRVTITGTFKDHGVNASPPKVRVWVKDPSGIKTTYIYPDDPEVVKVAEGVFEFSIYAAMSGRYYYRMDDNEVNVAEEGFFDVRRSQLV
jgi:hypothetical protein